MSKASFRVSGRGMSKLLRTLEIACVLTNDVVSVHIMLL